MSNWEHSSERARYFSDDPVSQWIEQLATSDQDAANRLWQHFCRRLMSYARGRLTSTARRVYDEEDAALSAFRSLCRGIESNRYPEINSRDNLWALLVVIAGRKIANRRRFDNQKKRDIRSTCTEDFFQKSDDAEFGLMQTLASRDPTPAFAAEVADTSEHLLSILPEPDLRQIVMLKLEGFTNEEAASKLNVTRRTIQRKLERIRRCWTESLLAFDENSAELPTELEKDSSLDTD